MAEQSSTSNNNKGSGSDGGTVCHILPCAIDQDLTAPIAQYFHPTRLPDDALPKSSSSTAAAETNVEDAKKTNGRDYTVMAAQFRGRGLLSVVDSPTSSSFATSTNDNDATREGTSNQPASQTLSKLPTTLMGVVLSPSTSSNTNRKTTNNYHPNNSSTNPPTQSLKVVEKFQHIYNWSHEHDVSKVVREQRLGVGVGGGSDKYGLSGALGWCDLAREVHDSIPLPP